MLNLYQVIDYTKKLPFRIHNIRRADIMDEFGDSKNVLDHWHWELEITIRMWDMHIIISMESVMKQIQALYSL